MSEKEKAETGKQENGEFTLDLSFAPSWARTSPEDNLQKFQKERYSDDYEPRRGGRDFKRERRAPREFEGGEQRRGDRRPPRRDFERGPSRDSQSQPRSAARGPRPEGGFRGPRAEEGFRGPRPEGDGRGGRDPRRGPVDRAPALPLEIRILPEQKALGALIRRIQSANRAYPLRDIAGLFLDKPASCLLRVEPIKDQKMPLFQCKVCGMPALSEEDIRAHVVNHHMDDFFDIEEIECEPPTGEFICVVRCGLSGELLGPPNHHSFNSRVQEMLRTRYANMSEEAYRARLETVRDPEAVEKWRQQCTRKSVYRRKDAAPTVADPEPPTEAAESDPAAQSEPVPKAPPLERDVAELVFLRDILPGQIASVRSLVCTAAIAMDTPSRPLYHAMLDALQRERRFPASLFFALRGAFRHRKLHLFRANEPRGQDFVILRQPTPLDPEHVIPELRSILDFVIAHPSCTRTELLTTLVPDNDEEKRRQMAMHLAWLVERSHLVHFYNDLLSPPEEHPAFIQRQPARNHEGAGESAKVVEEPAEASAAAPAPEAKATVEAPAPTPTRAPEEQAPAEVPATEPAPAEQAPAEETAPVEEPAAEPAPEEQLTVEEQAPVEESAPTQTPEPVEEPAAAEEQAPAAEPAQEEQAPAGTPVEKPVESVESDTPDA